MLPIQNITQTIDSPSFLISAKTLKAIRIIALVILGANVWSVGIAFGIKKQLSQFQYYTIWMEHMVVLYFLFVLILQPHTKTTSRIFQILQHGVLSSQFFLIIVFWVLIFPVKYKQKTLDGGQKGHLGQFEIYGNFYKHTVPCLCKLNSNTLLLFYGSGGVKEVVF